MQKESFHHETRHLICQELQTCSTLRKKQCFPFFLSLSMLESYQSHPSHGKENCLKSIAHHSQSTIFFSVLYRLQGLVSCITDLIPLFSRKRVQEEKQGMREKENRKLGNCHSCQHLCKFYSSP